MSNKRSPTPPMRVSWTGMRSPYGTDPHAVTFRGKCLKCGLYRTNEGLALNADVNGAANILHKSNHRLINRERVARGLLANPLRVKLT